MTIIHCQSWDTLPFISPLIWSDWITVYGLFKPFAPKLSFIPGVIGSCLYIVCLWLCVGYGSLGYGVHQYNVLSIPTQCQAFGPYQTDPRRYRFVCLHVAVFVMGTCGIYTAIFHLPGDESDPKHQYLHAFVGVWILLPAVAGAIVAGVVNGHSYLILNRNGCFASYVSGRLGYVDVDLIEWKIKLATWLGVNV